MTAVLERPVLSEQDTSDPDKHAHYTRKTTIVESAVMGTPVEALCGFVFVAKQAPERFPVCPKCEEIYQQMKP